MRQQPPVRKPEVMSPAGYWPQLRAAVEAGADSVYFGLKHFSARAKVGFTLTELPSVMRELHTRGVRGYVTFNTLIFEHEIAGAADAIAAIVDAGADALIMQDYGMVRLARQIAPGMELHASTQMSITDAAGVRQAQELGVQRVTLARELALTEVRSIIEQTSCDLEIFVHGALCVAYSGQCFSSEAWGGRSANRGQCAQACRLPYEMLVDGRLEPLADARYLLSPGDLYGLRQVPEIVSMGVSAMKIEGRYKDADYVALATAAYRKAVDEAAAGRKLSITPVEELQLEQVYSRGSGPFFLTGTNHQTVVNGRAPRHRGVCIGKVTKVSPDSVTIQPTPAHKIAPVKPGDGLVFDAASWRSPEEPEEGGRIFQSLPNLDGSLELKFGNNAVRFTRIHPGDLVWRTHDPALERVAKPYLEPAAPAARQPLHIRVTAAEGAPLVTEWHLIAHPEITTTVISPESIERAQNRGLTKEYLQEHLSRLGNTPYTLESIDLTCTGTPFAASSLLNRLRREAVEQLQAQQANRPHPAVNKPKPLVEAALRQAVAEEPASLEPQLHLLVRTPEQLEAALELAPASITLDYLDLYGLRPSVDKVKASGIAVRVASPRILKPGEARITNFLLSLDCPLVIRSTGILHALKDQPHADLIGDFSLNTANSLTASAYFELGLARLTPTHDLNADQVARLARTAGAARIEVIAYQHLPVFHTEHCVFCRFLSTGTTYKDCGRPCETHTVALKDPSGRAHPVMADVGCRNTVFGAEAQEASSFIDQWQEAGIRHFRLEFVHESAGQVREVTKAFQSYLKGESNSAQLAAELKRIAPQGVTQGSLFVPPDYLTLPILQ